MKAEKKAAEKEAKVKEQVDQKKTIDKSEQNNYGADEETLDPNVRAKKTVLVCYYTQAVFVMGKALKLCFICVIV